MECELEWELDWELEVKGELDLAPGAQTREMLEALHKHYIHTT